MAYALSRSAAARYAVAITLEGGFVVANGKERAMHTPARPLSERRSPSSLSTADSSLPLAQSHSIDISPSHAAPVRCAHPRTQSTAPPRRRKEEGIGVDSPGIVHGRTQPYTPLSHPFRAPLHYPNPKSSSPSTAAERPLALSAQQRLSQIKTHLSSLTPHRVSTMTPAQLTHEARMTRLLLLELDPRRAPAPQLAQSHRLRLLESWSVFFRLVERLNAVAEVPEGLVDQSTFDKAIRCVARSSKLRRPRKRLPKAAESPPTPSSPGPAARKEGSGQVLGAVKSGTRNLSTAIVPADYEDPWTAMTVPTILHLMSTLAYTPSSSALESMLYAQRTPLVPTGPHAMSIRSRLDVNHRDMGLEALGVWQSRSELLTSLQSFLPGFNHTRSYAHEVMRTLDEADVLSLESHEPWIEQRLVEMMGEWKALRDELVEEKRAVLAPMHKRWRRLLDTVQQPAEQGSPPVEGIGGETVKAETDREREAVVFLLRTALLPPVLQPPRCKAQAKGRPRLDDPFDLLGFLLGFGTSSTAARLSRAETREVVACVVRMRNSFYLNHLPNESNRLASILTPPTAGMLRRIGTTSLIMHHPGPLDGTVHASLLTSATRPSSMRHLLITLARLAPPASPPRIPRNTIKLLRSQVDHSAEYFSLTAHPEFVHLPQDAKHAAEAGGWHGLLDWLLGRWAVVEASSGDGKGTHPRPTELTQVRDLTLTRPVPRSAWHRRDPIFPYLAPRT